MELELEAEDPFKTRSSSKVLQLAEHAKLDPSELEPCTQTLLFSKNYGKENPLMLMEVDDSLLKYILNGETIIVRGEEEETAVLCTDSKVFEVREAETSNSCLIVPQLKIPDKRLVCDTDHLIISKEVIGTHYKYLELRECQPRLGKLNCLLMKKEFDGRNLRRDFGYKFDELCQKIQASDKEILNGLKKYKAYCIRDHWYSLELNYHFAVLSSILNLIDSNSISIYAVNKIEIIETLKDLQSETVLEQCFEYFFTPTEMSIDEMSVDKNQLYKVRENDVCVMCAEILLKDNGRFNLNEFLTIWKQSVPEGLSTDLSQLNGVALTDRFVSPPVIWHFAANQIPLDDVTEAFRVIFCAKEQWTLEEIAPYLSEFVPAKKSVTVLLTKYARSCNIDGVKYFSAKHRT